MQQAIVMKNIKPEFTDEMKHLVEKFTGEDIEIVDQPHENKAKLIQNRSKYERKLMDIESRCPESIIRKIYCSKCVVYLVDDGTFVRVDDDGCILL